MTEHPNPLEQEIARSKSLPPGSDHYRAYVGPPDQYDFMGATQLRLLTALGLREEHHVVDIGCGSLRAGKFLIHYLMPERYCGVEPNEWLWQTALDDEIGRDILALKRPVFSASDDFQLAEIDSASVDFVVAQSIYSHTGAEMLRRSLMAVARILRPGGQFLFTAITPGDPGYDQMPRGNKAANWNYPGCVGYPDDVVLSFCGDSGFRIQKLKWYHPRQSWFRATLDSEILLTEAMEIELGTGRPLFDPRFPL